MGNVEQIEKYIRVRPRYEKYALVLKRVLEQAAKRYAPQAIVQARAKTVVSFAEKIQRPDKACPDPVNHFTDLCGARVITHTQDEVNVVCEFIKDNFVIDRENSVDISQRLKPTEFGYRSVHYIVQFKRGVFPNKTIRVKIPEEVFPDADCPMKAEIQVRTLLEHAWADFTHDRSYKGAFKIPVKLERELAALAAVLEETDRDFLRIQSTLQSYAASYGNYLTEEQIRKEIESLEFVLRYDPKNLQIAQRVGKLTITLGDWEKAIEILSRFVRAGYAPILKDLGVAICKKYRDEPNNRQYRKGQDYLKRAFALNNKDVDALASLAGTWKNIEEHPDTNARNKRRARRKAREYYRQAFEIDPTDSYSLGNYLEYEIVDNKDVSFVPMLKTAINSAIQRCYDQVAVGVNMPWAFYDIGKFYLLLNKPDESLIAYARAIQKSPKGWMIETSFRSLKRLAEVREKLSGYEWVKRLLLLGWALKSGKDEVINEVRMLASGNLISGPVVILTGGCDQMDKMAVNRYQELLLEAFRDFRGTVISGGTNSGVSGLVGRVQETYPDDIYTIGYLPKFALSRGMVDNRYKELRYTESEDFSPLEFLQVWVDLLASGILPTQVKVLGINGGPISAAEYRIALTLEASVGIIKGSGGEAGNLLTDEDWNKSPFLVPLPADGMTVRAFIGGGIPKLPAEMREVIGRAIHDEYRRMKADSGTAQDPALCDWDKLRDDLKQSNLEQADHIFEKLRQIGCEVVAVKERQIELIRFTDEEIEKMAEMEHARWVVERLQSGWRWGRERDVANKISPYLVPWSELPEDVKEWDRNTVKKIPEFLAKVGLEVRRRG